MKKDSDIILKYALQNAVFYEGKANPQVVLGKVMANEPAFRTRVNEVRKEIERIVKEINRLPLEKQKERLQDLAPELLEKEEKKQEDLSPLHNAVMGRVVTRFAPAPTGPLNLSHLLRAVFLSYLYAKKYKGLFVLRFEDTDPEKVGREYYDWIKEDLKNAGVKWDKLVIESDNMELYYKHARELIGKNDIYACKCSAKKFREYKEKQQNCPDRDRGDTLTEWNKTLKGSYNEGAIVFRLKTSMKDPNPALRDPPMLRINKSPHPLQGRKYNLWPLYNFANVIEDHNSGITHVFRGKEHEHNTNIQKVVYDKLGWPMPTVVNFGMIYLEGMEKLHTRDIKEMIAKKQISGWDDPKLPTVRALVRRGFQPEAFKQCSILCSLTKTDIKFEMGTLESINRKIIDHAANRYMIVTNPVKISIKNSPTILVKEDLHPDFPDRGKKILPVAPREIYISKSDYNELKGKEFRLKGFGNIRLKGFAGQYTANTLYKDMPKIQWVSFPNIKVKIINPGGAMEGLGEINLKKLKPGALIQMERIGFGRIEKVGTVVEIMFAHK